MRVGFFSTEIMRAIRQPWEEVWWTKREVRNPANDYRVSVRQDLGSWQRLSYFHPTDICGEGTRWKAMHPLCNLYYRNIPPWPCYSAPERSHVLLFVQKSAQRQKCALFLLWKRITLRVKICSLCLLACLLCLVDFRIQYLTPPFTFAASLVAQMVKNLPANAGHPDLKPGWERSPGEGNSTPHWYSCLENPMDRGSWRITVHGVTKSQTPLSN